MPACTADRCGRRTGLPPARSADAFAPSRHGGGPSRSPALPRLACACGGSCPRCAASALSPQLPAQDREREKAADRFADGAAPALAYALAGTPSAPGPSMQLPGPVVAALKRSSGFDGSKVRLHADAASASAAQRLQARAYAFGDDIHFGAGQYQPHSAAGRHLLAHELAHVAQQRQMPPRLMLSPYADAHGTDDLHQRLTREYVEDTPGLAQPPSLGAVQYSAGYRQWLQAQAADGVKFLPTTFTQKDPMQPSGVVANGLTTYALNGKSSAGATLGVLIADLQAQLRPATVLHAPGLVQGQVQCRFDPALRIESSAHVDELSAPPPGGWTARLPPAAAGSAAECPGKSSVRVTLTDASGDPAALAKLVHDSELEHVAELRALHDRHFVAYYRFVTALTATAGSEAGCETALRGRIADRDAQAATAFALGDLAATRRFDDPASTHHGTLARTVSPGCSAITLTARQTHPPQPGAAPGNVMPVAPHSTPVDAAQLSVQGSDLMSAGRRVRGFASPADASTAMGAFAALGVTEILRIGPVEILMAGAQAAFGGSLQGLPSLALHLEQIQISVGVPHIDDWVISEVHGTQFVEIANFGAARDAAYSALDLIIAQKLQRQMRIGPAGGVGMSLYTA